MKIVIKIILFIIILFPSTTYALDRKIVTLKKCIDGDTVKVIMNKKTITLRMLAIDTPETNHPEKGEEPFGKEAKDFTCNKLTNAKKIELEFDNNSDKKDKYNRNLVWIFYDNKLLQKELVKNGYASVTYLYDDYKYTPMLKDAETYAKINKKGIYSNKDTSYYRKHKTFEERVKNRVNKFLKKLKANLNDLINEILEEII